jgi:hypothetical protein
MCSRVPHARQNCCFSSQALRHFQQFISISFEIRYIKKLLMLEGKIVKQHIFQARRSDPIEAAGGFRQWLSELSGSGIPPFLR